MEIDFEVYLYRDETNTGHATFIHPLSGYVWVDSDSGYADYVHPDNITAYDAEAFAQALIRADA